jgi:DNA-binding NtrC family response regulator
VLLVESERDSRAVAAASLTRAGYRVLAAASVDQALAFSEQHPFEIHVLVTDTALPRMSGRELAAAVAQRRPAIRVLLMSAHTEDVVLPLSDRDARVGFITKPCSPDALVRKVRETLDLDADGPLLRTSAAGS